MAVNNHVDIDGILSVYALVHSEHALRHRQALIEAADMGDFWGWGDPPAQRVFQGVTQLMSGGGDKTSIYEEAFHRIPGLVDGTDSEVPEIEESLGPLRESVELVQQGTIARRLRTGRFAQYIVPQSVVGDDVERAAYVPGFNEAISDRAIFWPQARARWDAERVCLVSFECTSGWFHDLCFPGYLWADTEGKRRPPGLTYHDGMSSYFLDDERLISAFAELQREETAAEKWGLGGTSLPCGDSLQDVFPVVGRFVDEQGEPAFSHLPPEHVASHLDTVF